MTSRGIYITANDKVLDHAIACLNSIRAHDPSIPVMLIPYNDDYHQVAAVLGRDYGVEVYPDLEFIQRLSENLHAIFGEGFFARPNQFRKQACWFGPFDRFLYIDTDVVVFSAIANVLDALDDHDFISYDYQHRGGIRNVFAPAIVEQGVFTAAELEDMFNCGFWGSKKGLVSEQDLYDTFAECAAHPDYFDFSEKTSDQPIINYLILKRMARRFNLVRQPGGGPGNWAGSPHFVQEGMTLSDPNVNKPLDYLHWAGYRIQPGCPYWDIWAHYRYLRDPDSRPADVPVLAPSPVDSLSRKASKLLSRLGK
ncbi:Npun_R2821/Npun_R2822 family protein [Nodosilinea sp. PGN35]|uniref:Npun_R2821/Npun_R2822 family protein n=1 Tax=Nodosilinea sp. PGN35 TaxID=3020489 RepID=UPI0023B2663A|nr:Npun_R2821/Npun_R2822 family protein [Nodosilinea sp. TSF1-S3]MDF0368084.1 methionine synthase [Nodosilinea sp. TSF1-S3]